MSGNPIATIALFIWLPIVVAIFTACPPRRAVIVAFLFAWLFLPNIGFNLPGLPNYTKMTATIAGVLLSAMIFDPVRFLSLRPRWFDLPMAFWCLSPFAASLYNDLGVYDGFSAVLEQMVAWGLPYLIGRAYFSDLDALRELGLGIIVGGLIYVPFCLIEIKFSPKFELWAYGLPHFEPMRFGGFRPKVFMSSGLELGMWMTCATLLAHRYWSSGVISKLRGYPFSKLALGLAITTLLCKSTGAFLLLVAGVGVLWTCRRLNSSWPAWILIAIAPLYTATRATGLWSGRQVLDVVNSIDSERAQSIEFRMINEDQLMARALEHPVIGWGRHGGALILDKAGKMTAVTDGYWIIILGQIGAVGLALLNLILLLPMALLIRRYPVATWSRPRIAPAAAMGVLLVLVMIDDLSNAMLNPIYAIVMGGLIALPSPRRGGRGPEAEAELALALDRSAEGHSIEAEPAFRRAIELASADDAGPEGREVQALALDGLGSALMATGRLEEAEWAFRDALAVREALAAESPDADHLRDLATAHEGVGRALAEGGRTAEAIEQRHRALALRDILVDEHPDDPEDRDRRLDALNDLAWLLATDADPAVRDPARAVRLAEEAVRVAPDHGAGWNTLGVARYRVDDWAGAIEALEHSVATGPPGGTAFDHFFLAMACRRLGDEDRAREWFDQAVAWADRHRPGHPALGRFRDEASALLSEPDRTRADIS